MTVDTSPLESRLVEEASRNQQLVAQSNNRAGSIAQAFAGLATLILALAALAFAGDAEPTGWTYFFGTISALGLALVVIAFGFVWWPQIRGLPNDASQQDLEARLNTVAASDNNAHQAYGLQQIHRTKERATRALLIGMVVMTVFGLLTIMTL